MPLSNLASTVLMGLFLIAVVAVIQLTDRRGYAPPESDRSRLDRLAGWFRESPTAWILVFFVLTFVAATFAVVSVVPDVGPAIGSLTVLAFGAVIAVLTLTFLLWGAYQTARSHGLGNSTAVAISAWLFGLLFALAIVAQLLVS